MLASDSKYDILLPEYISYRWLLCNVADDLMGLTSPDDETVGHVGAGALRFQIGGLTGLWPPNRQTWYFDQIFGPLPNLGHCQTVRQIFGKTRGSTFGRWGRDFNPGTNKNPLEHRGPSFGSGWLVNPRLLWCELLRARRSGGKGETLPLNKNYPPESRGASSGLGWNIWSRSLVGLRPRHREYLGDLLEFRLRHWDARLAEVTGMVMPEIWGPIKKCDFPPYLAHFAMLALHQN